MEELIKKYRIEKPKLESLKISVLGLLPILIEKPNDKSIIHLIAGRVKDEESLQKKIIRKEGKYNSLSDITDIVGIRIITYLESQVDYVSKIIESEFIIDKVNSTDKRKVATNEFGYKSLHFIVSMSEDRCKLPEYKNFNSIKFEVQIRSILQHAWAEIEHDLGYKSNIEVPDTLKRNFSRLSALLEIADVEFDKLKKELVSYEISLPKLIQNSPEEVEINKASLISFKQTNKTLINARKKIIIEGATFVNFAFGYEILIYSCNYLGLTMVSQLEEVLKNEGDKYLKFVEKFISKVKDKYVNGISESIELMYLLHYIAAKTQNEREVSNYLAFYSSKNNLLSAKGIIELFKSLE
ncbi:MAG: hypothetical protein JWP57_4349 [Spirosoma sp.]|nr:hypothetical protein [Spirosoma sp.]